VRDLLTEKSAAEAKRGELRDELGRALAAGDHAAAERCQTAIPQLEARLAGLDRALEVLRERDRQAEAERHAERLDEPRRQAHLRAIRVRVYNHAAQVVEREVEALRLEADARALRKKPLGISDSDAAAWRYDLEAAGIPLAAPPALEGLSLEEARAQIVRFRRLAERAGQASLSVAVTDEREVGAPRVRLQPGQSITIAGDGRFVVHEAPEPEPAPAEEPAPPDRGRGAGLLGALRR